MGVDVHGALGWYPADAQRSTTYVDVDVLLYAFACLTVLGLRGARAELRTRDDQGS